MRISDWSSDVCSSDLLVRIAERMAARAIERGLGGQASSVCRHARQRLPPLRHVEQRGVIHADDAALSLMFDVAGGALRRFRVELRRLLRPEIGDRMAGETGPGFDALARRVAARKSTRLNSSHSCATRMPSSA